MLAAGFKEIALSPSLKAVGPFTVGVDHAAQDDQTVILPMSFNSLEAKVQVDPAAFDNFVESCHNTAKIINGQMLPAFTAVATGAGKLFNTAIEQAHKKKLKV